MPRMLKQKVKGNDESPRRQVMVRLPRIPLQTS